MAQQNKAQLATVLEQLRAYDYTRPRDPQDETQEHDCDLVMKGGVTSGIVYPLAVLELAKSYRFHAIGGTSAGAIAAATTAAAEYGRASGGFQRLIDVVEQFQKAGFVANLFQPAPTLRPLLQCMFVVLKISRRMANQTTAPGWLEILGNIAALLRSLTFAPWRTPAYLGGAIGAVLGALLGGGWIMAALSASDSSAALRATIWGLLVIGLLWWCGGLLGVIVQIIRIDIVRNGFGICAGQPVPGHDAHRVAPTVTSPSPALTEWLATAIDTLAGVSAGPLTFGELERNHCDTVTPERKITLRMVTTNLSQGRPYLLPLTDHLFLFSEEEWRRLFPGPVVDHLVRHAHRSPSFATPCVIDDEQGQRQTLHFLPDHEQLPVIVATRMSLSFPLLLSAVPLWSISGETFVSDAFRTWPKGTPFPLTSAHVRRNWFSDGGICSNFPIHFFDRLFPRYPTFGINLSDLPETSMRRAARGAEYAPDFQMRQTSEENMAPERPRAVDLEHGIVFPSSYPRDHPGALWKPLSASVPGFLSAILNTGLFYRDTLQSQLPSYYDRIVTILLSSKEGGLNLDMPPEAIEHIALKGHLAGKAVAERFNLSHHQWVRLRLMLSQLEQQLIELHEPLLQRKDHADPAHLDQLLDTIGTFLQNSGIDQNIVQQLIDAEIAAYPMQEQRFPYARDTRWRNASLPRLYLLLLLIEVWGGERYARFQLARPTVRRELVRDQDHIQLRVTPEL